MPHLKQGDIVVDAAKEVAIPETHHAAGDRNAKRDREVQAAASSRMASYTAEKAEQPSTNALPSNKGLKMANHVHDVFKKR